MKGFRNFGIFAHIDAGKTTLSECILYKTGVEQRMGAVDLGTAAMDWHDEERERGITISAAVAHCPWQDFLLQFVDTPGHVDFSSEVKRSLKVIDGAIIVVDSLEGVQAQTYSVVEDAVRENLPLLFVFNKMDRDCVQFQESVSRASGQLKLTLIPIQLAYFDGDEFAGVIDLVRMKLFRWSDSELLEEEIPKDYCAAALDAHQDLCAQIAHENPIEENNFLLHSTLAPSAIYEGIRHACQNKKWFPVLATSALRRLGVEFVLDAIVNFFPSPSKAPMQVLHNSITGQDSFSDFSSVEPLVYVFKVEQINGKEVAYVRLFSGCLDIGQALYLVRDQVYVKVLDCFAVLADDLQTQDSFEAGSIFVIRVDYLLQSGDTLRGAADAGAFEVQAEDSPVVSMRVESETSEHYQSLLESCNWLCRVDPSLYCQEGDGQIILQGQGGLHLEIAGRYLNQITDFSVYYGNPFIEKYETIEGAEILEIDYHHFDRPDNILKLKIEFRHVDAHRLKLSYSPFLNSCPDDWLASLYSGELFHGWIGERGYPLRAIDLTILDVKGSDIPGLLVPAIHESLRTIMLKKGVVQVPFLYFQVFCPESELASVLADLKQRRADIRNIETQGDGAVVWAAAELEKLLDYSDSLRSQSRGRAEFVMGQLDWKFEQNHVI